MRTVGIICEYNPFHNGHAYQIREAKRNAGAEAAVCVMSGNYVQRGEPAIADKWSRAQWAVREGADLVLEMPTLWASAGAPDFAEGAVRLLHAMGVDAVSCGVECAAPEAMRTVAEILNQESEVFRGVLQEELKKGNSFVRSRETAVRRELKERGEEETAAQLLRPSNNILAIEYMRAAMKIHWEVPFVLVPRKGAGHNSEEEKDGFLSASAIREILRGHTGAVDVSWMERLKALPVPETVLEELIRKSLEKKLHPDTSGFLDLLYYRVSMMEPDDLRQIEGMGEGLENALIKACSRYQSWENLVEELTAQRYPASRIRRILLNVCLGITRKKAAQWKGRIPYLKILCFNDKGQSLIRSYRKAWREKKKTDEYSTDPILLTNPGKEAKQLETELQEFLNQEARWSDLYELTGADPSEYQKGREYRMNSLKIEK